MGVEFRPLKADEIECRINQLKEGKGKYEGKVYATILLYKDARCDQRILDECVGAMNWQRRHDEHRGNLFCAVGIYDNEKGEWIWKEDAGAESNMEAEKGHASDSFKRACFNWGIGRELYTPLGIYLELNEGEYSREGHRIKSYARFDVAEVETEDGVIKHIIIMDKRGNIRWSK